jgi:hypothetical protein
MQEEQKTENKPIGKNEIVGKGGPVAGSLISIIGNIFVLIGFVLPWASCSGYQLSGLDIVSGKANSYGNTNGSFLGIIPFLAVGVIGIALLTIPAALVKKMPAPIKVIGPVLVLLMTCCACLPSFLFFTNIQSTKNDPGMYGMGGFVKVEYGFWVTIFGLLISLFGGFLGIGSSLAVLLMNRKKIPDKKT